MEAIVAFLGTWALVLSLTSWEVLRDMDTKKKYYQEYAKLPAITDSDRDIYLTHEAYNRYQGTDYRGDKP
jgi:hypothetical protein